MSDVITVSVTILDKEFQVNCPAEEQAALQDSARVLERSFVWMLKWMWISLQMRPQGDFSQFYSASLRLNRLTGSSDFELHPHGKMRKYIDRKKTYTIDSQKDR